jgi:phosphoglycolate phosphatase-like HAD superfamily hydrolase
VKVLLFDIDGTLLLTHGVGRRSVELALAEVTGRPIDSTPISFSGKTDPQILIEVFEANGIAGHTLNGMLDEALDRYSHHMRKRVSSRKALRCCPAFRPSWTDWPNATMSASGC